MPATVQPDSSLTEQVVRLQALLEASRTVHSTMELAEVLRISARIAVLELELEGALFTNPQTGDQTLYGELPADRDDLPHFDLLSRDGHLLTELIVAKPGELTLYERDFLEGLTLQTAVAVENAINHERHLEYARLARDLDAARGIQRSLLPQQMPMLPGYSVAARSRACYEVGGDYLDVTTEPGNPGSALMVVADVAGKGMASALICTAFRSAFRTLARQSLPLEELAGRLSQQHYDEGDEARRRYVTAIFLRLHPTTGELEFLNAGHNPGILLSPTGTPTLIHASGTPLGMLPGATYSVERQSLPPGARLLLYTDGLTEVFHREQEFGEDRLLQTFTATTSRDAEPTLDHLWQTLDTFAQGTPQSDDMSAITLTRLP